jgi:hypothetical protein
VYMELGVTRVMFERAMAERREVSW